ncbi:MAG TPA: type IV secretory system conjugative DNA transfer family protein, partial [Symbiobacteriaceae bacterium]|nr:type IV secretory system conjugative DNA transfer family protein [Symbiobacteriaceae bacterium]
MADRWKPVVLWGITLALAAFVAAYLLGSLALLLEVATQDASLEMWKATIRSPWTVLRLLVSDPGVKRYGLSIGGLALCGGIWVWMEFSGKSSKPTMASHYGSHGTGRWARAEEILAQFPEHGPGAVLGRLKIRNNWRTVIFPWDSKVRNRFLLIVGPPGSGKTSRYSLPNLLHAARGDTRRSILATDPKGELYRNMAGVLR